MFNDVRLSFVNKLRKSKTEEAFVAANQRGVDGSSGRKANLKHLRNVEDGLQQPNTNESDNNISSCSTLDIVNKMDNVTIQNLEIQVRELSQRLQQAQTERVDIQKQLKQAKHEKEQCCRRMEVISSAHECRITEMHCVIAELSKKLHDKQQNIIEEEQEPEASESYQEFSLNNSEECQTEPLESEETDIYVEVGKLDDEDINDDFKLHKKTMTKGQVEALQEEVLHLKAQIALLQSEISNSLCLDQPVADDIIVQQEKESCHIAYNSGDEVELDANEQQEIAGNQSDMEILTCKEQVMPFVAKMAERVSLRKKYSENTLKKKVMEYKDFCNCSNEEIDLKRQLDQLKVNNTILSLTLNECKEHCEHLYLLCGKYESNAMGLQLAVNCSDRAIEAYDVMLALLESKLALMLNESITADENIKAVESVARHLLDRLESEKEVCENSLGPWQNTFSIVNKNDVTPWTTEDDNRLRYHVSKLKACRATLQNTIVQLESPFSDPYEKTRLALEKAEQFDKEDRIKTESGLMIHKELEMAVLTQELLNLHDENVMLKTKLENTEREHKYSVQRNTVLQDLLGKLEMQMNTMAAATNVTVEHMDSNTSQTTISDSVLFEQCQKDSQALQYIKQESNYTETENAAALAEQQLIEALTRETELKGRIQTLIASKEVTQKLGDDKQEELYKSFTSLQVTNQNLAQLLEQNKRKYHLRMRKLEQRIMEMTLEIGRQKKALAMQQCADNLWEYKNMLTDPQTDNVPETTL